MSDDDSRFLGTHKNVTTVIGWGYFQLYPLENGDWTLKIGGTEYDIRAKGKGKIKVRLALSQPCPTPQSKQSIPGQTWQGSERGALGLKAGKE